LSIGGGRPTQNSYRLDGVVVNDYSNAGPGSVLGRTSAWTRFRNSLYLPAITRLNTASTSGGVINASQRAGTNSFHGTAFDFLRNSVLGRERFLCQRRRPWQGPAVQNQFGAAAGYKILKDKLFLFGDYEA